MIGRFRFPPSSIDVTAELDPFFDIQAFSDYTLCQFHHLPADGDFRVAFRLDVDESKSDPPPGNLGLDTACEPLEWGHENGVLSISYQGAQLTCHSAGPLLLVVDRWLLETAPEAINSIIVSTLSIPFMLQGAMVIHAAGAMWRDTSVLLLGASGQGKSTLTLAMLEDQARVVSDDLLLLWQSETGEIQVRPMRAWLSIRPSTRSTGDLLEKSGSVGNPGNSLPERIDRASMPDRFIPVMSPEVALMVGIDRQAGSKTRLQPMDQALFLANIINGTAPLCFTRLFADRNQKLLKTARNLATGIPAYHCNLGADLLERPEEALQEIFSSIQRELKGKCRMQT